MKFIFAVLLLVFAVFLNLLEQSSQSGEEPPFLSMGKWRLYIGFKGFPKRPGSSESKKSNENPLQNRSGGPTRQENLTLARENKSLSEEDHHPEKPQSQFPIHPGSSELGSVNPQLTRENENSRQYRPNDQTSRENLPPVRKNENYPQYRQKGQPIRENLPPETENENNPEESKVPPRDPGDPDDPGVVFWLPTHN